MARIRSIKPDFFQDEKVGQLSRDARILFVATWTVADDAGTFRANPAMLMSQAFPYDGLKPKQVSEWLSELERVGLVVLYEVNGDSYGHIKNFSKHQKIDKPSRWRLPLPESSPSPREDSDYGEGEGEGKGEGDGEGDGSIGADAPESVSPQRVVELYRQTCVLAGMPDIRKLTDQRKRKIRTRSKLLPTEADWARMLAAASEQSFLAGDNERGWRADFDWLIANDENPSKVLERRYARGSPLTPAQRVAAEVVEERMNEERHEAQRSQANHRPTPGQLPIDEPPF